MKKLLNWIIEPVSSICLENALFFMRVGLGIVTVIHGVPKIFGGIEAWEELGKIIFPLGIHFFPAMWGFLGACTQFFGGISFILGLGTRIASACLTFMMFVAVVWHLSRGDIYNIYAYPLSLIVVFITFLFIGSGKYSLDNYLINKV